MKMKHFVLALSFLLGLESLGAQAILHVKTGETKTIGKAESKLIVEQLIMEDNSTITLARSRINRGISPGNPNSLIILK